MNLILTDNQLFRLTGYRQGWKQAEVLEAWGIPYVMGRDNRPRVLPADVERPGRAYQSPDPNIQPGG